MAAACEISPRLANWKSALRSVGRAEFRAREDRGDDPLPGPHDADGDGDDQLRDAHGHPVHREARHEDQERRDHERDLQHGAGRAHEGHGRGVAGDVDRHLEDAARVVQPRGDEEQHQAPGRIRQQAGRGAHEQAEAVRQGHAGHDDHRAQDRRPPEAGRVVALGQVAVPRVVAHGHVAAHGAAEPPAQEPEVLEQGPGGRADAVELPAQSVEHERGQDDADDQRREPRAQARDGVQRGDSGQAVSLPPRRLAHAGPSRAGPAAGAPRPRARS